MNKFDIEFWNGFLKGLNAAQFELNEIEETANETESEGIKISKATLKELEDFYGEEGRRIKESLQKIYDKAKSFNGNGTSEDIDDLYHRLV
ncbi:MAG: hypothetical protein ACP5NO_02880, partial [Thermoplasmata archaeon]